MMEMGPIPPKKAVDWKQLAEEVPGKSTKVMMKGTVTLIVGMLCSFLLWGIWTIGWWLKAVIDLQLNGGGQ